MSTPHFKISIGSTVLPSFTSFDLRQSVFGHHTFDLVVSHEVVEELGSHVMDGSKNWIGESFTAEFGDNQFIGIVTSISMDHFAGLNGNLIISGSSPTIILDAGPHLQSWTDQTLAAIVGKVVPAKVMVPKLNAAHKATVPYVVQYRESNFGFLKRLAATYCEWFFYDGSDLYFGKPSAPKEVKLVYGTDVESIRLLMRMKPIKASAYSYNSLRDENLKDSSPNEVAGLNDLGSQALSASLDKFSLEPQSTVFPRVDNKDELKALLKKQQAAKAANLSTLIGTGTKMELKPGIVIDVSAAIHDGKAWQTKPYGKYVIVSIRHSMSGNYEYSNTFEAIPADVSVLPEPEIRLPVAEPQTATVKSNNDPQKKGRVQVQFQWQSGESKTPWIRVMAHDAGKSGNVPTNRGLVTIPEEGDTVMVGFRYNDATRPFVMGSMFNGSTGGGGGDGNKTKSLTTRSGATITIDDSAGKGSITISEPSGNVITMDGAGNVSITGAKTIALSAAD